VIISSLVVAVIRQIWWDYFANFRGPLAFFGIPVLPMFCCLIGIGIPSLLLIGLLTFRWTKRLITPILLLGGVAAAFVIPVPPPRPTPEENYFREHRDDFEHVVTLARQGQLEQALPDCPAGYRPPDEYFHVSAAHCISINRDFRVQFYPVERSYWIVYVEIPTDYPCLDGNRAATIDDHWYVCFADWP
jgi:hypothetical protein